MESLQRLIAAIWLGGGVFLMLAASAAFRAAPTPGAAAEVVGAMLTRWHYIALAAPLLLFAMELRNARKLVIIVVFAALMLAAAQAFVDLKIRSIRDSSIVPISSLDREDPVRRRFGALHGVSMMLLAAQLLGAAVVVMMNPRRDAPHPTGRVEAVRATEVAAVATPADEGPSETRE